MSASPANPARSGASSGRSWDSFLSAGALLLMVVVLAVVIASIEPRFLRKANLFNVLRNTSFLAIVSAGQMLVLIVGGFDLSVGAVVALTSITTASVMAALMHAFPEAVPIVIFVGIGAGILAGAGIGLINGLCVAFLRVSPFMVTLGTLSIASGIALYYTTGIPVYGMPREFTKEFGRAIVLGLPAAIFVAVAIIGAVWFMQRRTRFGRYVYAIGGNMQAARVSGVPVNYYLICTYVLCSALAAVTGVLLTARIGSGQATMGSTLMLESIAAAVIGGVSLRGGVGRVELVALSALFLSIITNGMNLIRIDSKIQTLVLGVVLILAVAFEQWNERRRNRV
ncbi:MAG: ABC transporter permease [Gammaproteobacteria bacterium]